MHFNLGLPFFEHLLPSGASKEVALVYAGIRAQLLNLLTNVEPLTHHPINISSMTLSAGTS